MRRSRSIAALRASYQSPKAISRSRKKYARKSRRSVQAKLAGHRRGMVKR